MSVASFEPNHRYQFIPTVRSHGSNRSTIPIRVICLNVIEYRRGGFPCCHYGNGSANRGLRNVGQRNHAVFGIYGVQVAPNTEAKLPGRSGAELAQASAVTGCLVRFSVMLCA